MTYSKHSWPFPSSLTSSYLSPGAPWPLQSPPFPLRPEPTRPALSLTSRLHRFTGVDGNEAAEFCRVLAGPGSFKLRRGAAVPPPGSHRRPASRSPQHLREFGNVFMNCPEQTQKHADLDSVSAELTCRLIRGWLTLNWSWWSKYMNCFIPVVVQEGNVTKGCSGNTFSTGEDSNYDSLSAIKYYSDWKIKGREL